MSVQFLTTSHDDGVMSTRAGFLPPPPGLGHPFGIVGVWRSTFRFFGKHAAHTSFSLARLSFLPCCWGRGWILAGPVSRLVLVAGRAGAGPFEASQSFPGLKTLQTIH